ncbi:MAG TPA: thioredoxin domain-containing protein [Candidatus Binatia bacterium]|jgi:protein-disulfide isomerase|nr:thioredoxin domain-containing protein [Candidatus Binatia bacterium]
MGRSIVIAPLLGIVALAGCGNPADIEELKKGQKEILAKLEALDKTVQTVKTAAPAAPSRPQIDPSKVYTIAVEGAEMKGPKDAKVTIVKFSDYQCPFCAQSAPLVDQMLAAYPKDVNFVYKQFPLTSIHPQAMGASKAALAAGKQGKFWEMHALLFENYRQLSPEKFKELAQKLNLDMAQFDKDVNSPEIAAQVDSDMKQARTVDVTGTPTFFVNGKRLMNRSPEGFKQMIDEALKAKG